jgi:hypothetical protein
MKKLWTALLCGCGIEPFETPSAYAQQQYLCDPEGLDVLEDAANACREEPEPCSGYISFRGEIQRVRLTVDTEIQRSLVRVAQSEGARNLSRVELSASAPYFHFDATLSSLGTPWPDEPSATHWPLEFEAPSPETALIFDDGFGAVQWYIRAGSDTAMLTSNRDDESTEEDEGGIIGVGFVGDERVDLRFAGSIGPAGDALAACAIVFPDAVETVPVP